MTKLEELKAAFEAADQEVQITVEGETSEDEQCWLTYYTLANYLMPSLLEAVEKLQWIAEFCTEHPEWFGGDSPDDGAENEWLHNTLRFLEKLK